MNHKVNRKPLLALAAAMLLSGCSMFGGGETEDVPTGQDPMAQGDTPVVDVGTYSSGKPKQISSLPVAESEGYVDGMSMSPDALRKANVVYFDFDEASVRDDSRETLLAHANYLARNTHLNVLLAGHADERGTREYNMALGEKRAIAVRNFLVANGVRVGQLETVSYGEEKPAAYGATETAWSRNRRVELLYQK